MESVRASTISGYNKFVAQQARLPGHALITLLQFEYDAVYRGVHCRDIEPMRFEHFIPRGNTALLDAMGRTITEVGIRLADMPEPERPAKVVVVILTDGEENASKQFTCGQIASMVTHQREVWDFVYLGANQDAIFTGAALGIPSQSSLSYAADAIGVEAVLGSTSAYVGSLRARGSASFEVDDRVKQQRP